MRVLGVDPGLTRCGIGVIDATATGQLQLRYVDVIRTRADAELANRLVAVADALSEVIDRFRPDAVAIERVFSQHNVRTVMGTAQVSGLAMVAAARAGARVASHTPTEVKAAVTGSGAASKAQIAVMVARLLQLPETPSPADAADALALAICHAWRGRAQARLAAALAGHRAAATGPVTVRSAR